MTARSSDADREGRFAFSGENLKWAREVIARYPAGREASAVIPLLWRAQEQNGGWLSRAAVRCVAEMLGMPLLRAMEVAEFYSMFRFTPVGSAAHLEVCGGLPCMLRGSERLVEVCRRMIGREDGALSEDGRLSWEECECLGACANAPVAQAGAHIYEDLTAERLEEIIGELAAGRTPPAGPQNGRRASEPLGGPTTLTDESLYEKGSDAAKLIRARAGGRGRGAQEKAKRPSGRRRDAR